MNHAELEIALKEWRDTRTAIFDAPVDIKTTPQQFEHVLMDLARKLEGGL